MGKPLKQSSLFLLQVNFMVCKKIIGTQGGEGIYDKQDFFYPFRVNLAKKSKFSVYDEDWYLDQLEYAEFDSDAPFFCLV